MTRIIKDDEFDKIIKNLRAEGIEPFPFIAPDFNFSAKFYALWLRWLYANLESVKYVISQLLKRKIATETTDSIILKQDGNWEDKFIITLSALLKLSKHVDTLIIKDKDDKATQFEISNALKVFEDGAYSPDYQVILNYLNSSMNEIDKELDKVKDELDDVKNEVGSIDVKTPKLTLLWKSDDLGVNSEQTITLNDSYKNYDYVEVIYSVGSGRKTAIFYAFGDGSTQLSKFSSSIVDTNLSVDAFIGNSDTFYHTRQKMGLYSEDQSRNITLIGGEYFAEYVSKETGARTFDKAKSWWDSNRTNQPKGRDGNPALPQMAIYSINGVKFTPGD